MAVRSVATTDTLETFRTTFNSLAATDIGDKASLTTTEKGSIVGAINELTSEQYAGFTISDSSSCSRPGTQAMKISNSFGFILGTKSHLNKWPSSENTF